MSSETTSGEGICPCCTRYEPLDIHGLIGTHKTYQWLVAKDYDAPPKHMEKCPGVGHKPIPEGEEPPTLCPL